MEVGQQNIKSEEIEIIKRQDSSSYLSSKESEETTEESLHSNNITLQRKIYIDLQNDIKNKNDEIYKQRNKNDNIIKTTQYILPLFFLKVLFYQFRYPLNLYFGLKTLLNFVPILRTSEPVSWIIPLASISIINLLKEGFQEYRRYCNDKLANELNVLVYDNKQKKFVKQKCYTIKVGNIVKVRKDEICPADLLIIKTSLHSGECYMQTESLDGETTLKQRESVIFKKRHLTKNNIIGEILEEENNINIRVKNPSIALYENDGSIIVNNKEIFFNSKNVLLRDSILKNVDYVYGIAIYIGKETKALMNMNIKRKNIQ